MQLPAGHHHVRFSRRNLLLGAGALAGAALAADAGHDVAGASTLSWPVKRLGSKGATTVDASQFLSVAQLRQWHEELDAMGMRSTGSPVHEHFIDVLVSRLRQAGVDQVHTEPVPLERWSAHAWSLQHAAAHSKGRIASSSFIPYSGSTPPGGVTGPLTLVKAGEPLAPGSLVGKIALFDVPTSPVAYSLMEEISYGRYDPQGLIDPAGQYSRPWGGVGDLITFLDALTVTGAIGCIGIIDLPAAGAHGSYYPYDGSIRMVPGVFVDGPTGQYLAALATSNTPVRLTLAATTEHMVSRNVVGLIPGRTNEVVILNSHTDGPNAVEDNGPNTIIAMAQYLCRLPKGALPRTVMVSFTTGHFHGGIGQITFVKDHKDTTLPHAACALTLELKDTNTTIGPLDWHFLSTLGLSLLYIGLCRIFDLVLSGRQSESDKNVEIMVLRHQVRVLERQLHARVRYRPADRADSRCTQPIASSNSVAVLPGYPRHAAAMAPGSGQTQVAPLAEATWYRTPISRS